MAVLVRPTVIEMTHKPCSCLVRHHAPCEPILRRVPSPSHIAKLDYIDLLPLDRDVVVAIVASLVLTLRMLLLKLSWIMVYSTRLVLVQSNKHVIWAFVSSFGYPPLDDIQPMQLTNEVSRTKEKIRRTCPLQHICVQPYFRAKPPAHLLEIYTSKSH